MTDKVTLAAVGSLIDATSAQTVINNNTTAIVAAIDNTLSRDGTAPNQMQVPLDMNSQQILNLPAPTTNLSPLRLTDLNSFIGGGTISTVPVGGTTGQGLTKASNANYDMAWTNVDTSVGLAMPADFTITNSPVVGTGTITAAYAVTPTGSGPFVKQTSPILITPNLGTPSAVNLANATNMAISNVGGLGTGVASALGTAVGATGGITSFNGALGTPTSGTLTNTTGLPIATGVSGLAAGAATFLTTPTSANLATLMTDETGTGANVFATSPTLVTPVLGTPTSGTLTNCTLPASGLTGTTLAASVVSSSLTSLGTSPTITTPNITGTVAGGNATTGSVGEYMTSSIVQGSAVALTNNTAANMTSLSLTAGDWDVWCSFFYLPAATTNITQLAGSISTTTAVMNNQAQGITAYASTGIVPGVLNCGSPLAQTRINVSTTTPVFAVAQCGFTVSTLGVWGTLSARRVR